MRIRLKVQDVAIKQLESAIWMYAYDYDEVAVHTVAGAAFEIYSKRLNSTSFGSDMVQYIKPEKHKEFISLWNKPYNFFKHGEHRMKPIEEMIYDEEVVELLIYYAAEANLNGPEEYRLTCANTFKTYFMLKHPELWQNEARDTLVKLLYESDLCEEDFKDKKHLKLMLEYSGHTFINGTNTPYRDVAK